MSHKVLSNPASSSRLLSFPNIRIALVTFPHIQLLRHSKLCPILGSQLLLFFLPDTLVPIPSQGRLFLPFGFQFNVIPLKTSSLTTLFYMAHLLLEMTSQHTFPFVKFFVLICYHCAYLSVFQFTLRTSVVSPGPFLSYLLFFLGSRKLQALKNI